MKVKAIVGFILTIVAIVFAFGIGPLAIAGWLCVASLPVAIVGLCLSVSARKGLKAEGQSAGLATAGLIVGIIATVFAAISFVTCGLCTICATLGENAIENAADDAAKELENLF